MAIIILSLILLFGYKSVKDLITKSDQIDYIHFKTKLESTIKRVDYGDRLIEEFSVPKAYKEICFIDLKDPAPIAFKTDYPIIHDSWDSDVKTNVFLVASKEDTESFYVEKIIVNNAGDNYLCFSATRGKIKASFEGIGRDIQVSEP